MPSSFFLITSHRLLTYSYSTQLSRILHFGLRRKSRNRVIRTESASHIATFQNPDQQASQKKLFHIRLPSLVDLTVIRAAEKNPGRCTRRKRKEGHRFKTIDLPSEFSVKTKKNSSTIFSKM